MIAFLRRHSLFVSVLIVFALALVTRAGALKQYVTPDEPVWVLRSLNFSQALARGDWAATAQIGHPGVTTMWLGSLGIAAKRLADPVAATDAITWLNRITALAPENAEAFKRLGVFLTFARLPVILVNALGVAGIFLLLHRLFDRRTALIAGLLFALDPFVAGLSGLLHLDGLLMTFCVLSVLALLVGMKEQRSAIRWFALSGALAALAFLSKSPGLFLLPFALLVLFVSVFIRRLSFKRALLGFFTVFIVHWSLVIALYPAMWTDPLGTLNGILGLASFYSANPVRPSFFDGQYVLNHGANFYPTALIYRLTPVVMLGLIIAPLAMLLENVRQKQAARRDQFAVCLTLLAFAILFIIAITPVAKKYDRYLLPALAMLIPIAAWGYAQLRWRIASPIVLAIAAVITLSYWPYLLLHYNALLGGLAQAQQHFAVGWGEGLGAAAKWINTQPNGLAATVATTANPSFAPIFSGRATLIDDRSLELSDYYVITLSERQLIPDLFAQLEQRGSIVHEIDNAGIPIAWVLINQRAEEQAALLTKADPASDVIVTLLELPLARRYAGAAQLIVLPPDVTPIEIEHTLNDLSTRYRRLWVTWSTALSPVVQDALRGWLDQTATLADTTDFGATQISVYDLHAGRTGTLDPLVVQFNGNFALLGLHTAQQNRNTFTTLRWRALAPVAMPYSITLQLVDAQGNVWNTSGGLIVDRDQFAANVWPPGHVADQTLTMKLPEEAPPGTYGVRVSVDQSDGQRVGLFSARGTFSGTAPILSTIDLPETDQPIGTLARPAAYAFSYSWDDQIDLIGFDGGPGVVINGDLWTVSAIWHSRSDRLPDLGVLWEISDRSNKKVFSTRLPLSAYPTSLWREGEVIGARYTLRFPPDLTKADYHLALGVTAPDGTLLDGGLFTPFDVRLLYRERSFTLPISPTLNVQFSDPAITLIAAQRPLGIQPPGAPLPVTVYWRAATTTDELYTIFVHLEALDGTVIAQLDSQPQGGGMPTAAWATGQIIEDTYPLTIPANTPPGAYRVTIGLYNPLDGTHLIDTATGEDQVVLDPPVIVH